MTEGVLVVWFDDETDISGYWLNVGTSVTDVNYVMLFLCQMGW